jgi:fumarate reductase flavoprotein subunit
MAVVKVGFDGEVDAQTGVAIIGAGACGLTAALHAKQHCDEVLVVERDKHPGGSTAMSSGFIPAAGTRYQNGDDRQDSPLQFAKDIQHKAHNEADHQLVDLATSNIVPAMHWLDGKHQIGWQVLDDFLYPGHRYHRMHTVREKTGRGLHSRLLNASEIAGVDILTEASADTIVLDDSNRVIGLELVRPDGRRETIQCQSLILACNGYGGNAELVKQHLPYISEAIYHGHPGNTGDALLWGGALNARTGGLNACQGHGSVATPHNILITWALMMQGGVQLNKAGWRFSNELGGYSEQAVEVLRQPQQIAWNVYDEYLHDFAMTFPDYQEACKAGAVIHCDSLDELARRSAMPLGNLKQTLTDVAACKAGVRRDKFGRDFNRSRPFKAPWYAVKVTGALFHTQGGLMIDQYARVKLQQGSIPNLFAGGGAACGVSGNSIEGYLSGNGLLTAITFGWIAGRYAGKFAARALPPENKMHD